jgi:hypothetical protein
MQRVADTNPFMTNLFASHTVLNQIARAMKAIVGDSPQTVDALLDPIARRLLLRYGQNQVLKGYVEPIRKAAATTPLRPAMSNGRPSSQ